MRPKRNIGPQQKGVIELKERSIIRKILKVLKRCMWSSGISFSVGSLKLSSSEHFERKVKINKQINNFFR